MTNPEKIAELEEKIRLLAIDLGRYRDEILALQSQLNQLKSGTQPVASKAVPSNQHTAEPGFENFVGLRLIHFIGIIVLVIGLAIGVKFAIDRELLPPLFRIGFAYLAGLILFILSVKMKKNYGLFSMILFGGSMATAYFTTYGAFAYYSLFPNWVAFVLMIGLTIFTVFQALKYNRQEIAVLGLVGAYGIPFLVRGKDENVIFLFSYILLVNIGVVYLLFRKYWKVLLYMSFVITWLVFLTWAFFKTDRTGEVHDIVFAILYFLVFAISSIAFKIRTRQVINELDAIVFILNVIALYASLAMSRIEPVDGYPKVLTLLFGIGMSAVALMARYVIPVQEFFRDSLFAAGMLMVIIFVPMQFDYFTITVIWILMAITFFGLGVWRKYKVLRILAIGLFAITILKLVIFDSLRFTDVEKIIAYVATGSLLLLVSFLYQKFRALIFENDGA